MFEKRCRAHEEAWGAIATLGAVVLQECLLYRVERVRRRQSLNGSDAAAGNSGYQGHAGVDRQIVQQYCAGSTLPSVAASLGSGQAELFAENVEQSPASVDFQIVRLAVDVYVDG